MPDASITIIGAGVIGLAVAERLSQKWKNIYVLEKNERYGLEASSRNSEVIHAGIYYPQDSLKARLCLEGNRLVYELCEKHDIPHKRTTKIIVATSKEEVEDLERFHENAKRNGVTVEIITGQRAKSLEPNVNSYAAIYSPASGILSAHGMLDYFYQRSKVNGVTHHFRTEVVGVEKSPEGFRLSIKEASGISTFTSEIVVNAAGLQSDHIASLAGINIDEARYRLHYCKGSYFSVTGGKRSVVSRLVYPIPQKEGLGIHSLPDLAGRLRIGPDTEYMPNRQYNYQVDESKRGKFFKSIRKMIPAIEASDLEPDISGIRAKLQAKGEPPRDFVIVNEKERNLEGLINLIGFDSPGLTSAPAVARYVESLL